MDVTRYPVSTITSSDEHILAIAQATVAEPNGAASDPRCEVLARLTRYRNYYAAEIKREQERIVNINQALARLEPTTDSDTRGRAMDQLTRLLEDAQRCLCDARLAKERYEMEIAQWLPSGNGQASAAND
ncbi:hypothetical protein IWW55_003711 [Coemansia sp. RSA 2706]|nr:hypothetical protein LPJ63_002215 [Coemansia sp. RSA 2711]KAJ2301767.1 hypothetical protein IWW55_003711 [Coemansia sp. RSA 2706]KAJ2306460.1 hypothetical protein IWW54_004734 [Coemansia sp. RSA 2705]KAJ2313709.1 hypothetical protein IWW52_004488 [Coemansia sp. RSA 2704]KAJ2324376.1 hypothetical protein IWW51_003301 [Coemansia sp. RSA 2702]KAJ2360708.1 hypothetical protein H4S01_005609 [Coemansia sp. RSA 2610]KAJ2389081.1 hypothetical protein H4S02_002544 [Coemansia sp. RSA 2611]KAJ272341